MNNDLLSGKKIAIVGGGPGGLLLARLLQMNGLNVQVYERDLNEYTRVQGATLNINEDSGLKGIKKAGLMEAFQKAYRPGADGIVFTDHKGAIIFTEPPNQQQGEDRPEIDRGPLRKLLLNSLRPGTVVWDHQFVSLEKMDDGMELIFKNYPSVTADLVIAADGANSKIRPYITPIKPVYSGITIIEGTIYDTSSALPGIYQLMNGGKICAVGDNKSLFVVLKGDDSSAFYTGHAADEQWVQNSGINFNDPNQVLAWYKTAFSSWGKSWHELFEKSAAFIARPQYYAPPDQKWEALPNITMIGDAAHVMPPYAGEGVNMAMADADELTGALLSGAFADIQSAIATYEEKMRNRTAAVIRETLDNTAMFHATDTAEKLVTMFNHTQ